MSEKTFEEQMDEFAKEISKVFVSLDDNLQDASIRFGKWRETFCVDVWTNVMKEYRNKR